MAKNISLLGADYPDVPAVVLPKTGGGSAMFVDADDINDFEDAIAIVIDGDTAPKAISKGQYLFIKNHSTLATGGYHATADISSGGSVSSSNVSGDADGIANALQEQTISKTFSLTIHSDSSAKITNFTSNSYQIGKFVICNASFKISSDIYAHNGLFTINSNHYRADGYVLYRNDVEGTNCPIYPIYTEANNAVIKNNHGLPATTDWVFFNMIIVMK